MIEYQDENDLVLIVIAHLLPLSLDANGYFRGNLRCCNHLGPRYTCTLLPNHNGLHCATDLEQNYNDRQWSNTESV